MTGHIFLNVALIVSIFLSTSTLFAEGGDALVSPPPPTVLKKIESKPKQSKTLDGVAKLKCRQAFEKEAASLHVSAEMGSACTLEDKKSATMYSLVARASDTSLSYNMAENSIYVQQRSIVSGELVSKIIKLNNKCEVETVTLRDSHFKNDELVIDKQSCVPTLNNYRYLKMHPGMKTKRPGISKYLEEETKRREDTGFIEYNDFYQSNCLNYEKSFFDKTHVEDRLNVFSPSHVKTLK